MAKIKARIRKRGIIGKPGGEPLVLADGRDFDDAKRLKRYIAEHGHPPPTEDDTDGATPKGE